MNKPPEWADLVADWVKPEEWHRWKPREYWSEPDRWEPGEYWSEPVGPGRWERVVWRVRMLPKLLGLEDRCEVTAETTHCKLLAPTSRDNLPDTFRQLSAALAAFKEAK